VNAADSEAHRRKGRALHCRLALLVFLAYQ
jgi:hypothetical protein